VKRVQRIALVLAALAVGLGGWLRAAANLFERALAIVAALLLFYVQAATSLAGLAVFAIVIGMHLVRTRRLAATSG